MKTNLKSFALGASLTLGLLGVYALAVSVPNIFASGDVISAAKMNANFAALKTATDALEAKVATLESLKKVALAIRIEASLSSACTFIDNPVTNNNPTAVLTLGESRTDIGVTKLAGPFFLNNKWAICTGDNSAQTAITEYHVMVVNP
jgi:hypothetical protein